jgi:hypothetical protein
LFLSDTSIEHKLSENNREEERCRVAASEWTGSAFVHWPSPNSPLDVEHKRESKLLKPNSPSGNFCLPLRPAPPRPDPRSGRPAALVVAPLLVPLPSHPLPPSSPLQPTLPSLVPTAALTPTPTAPLSRPRHPKRPDAFLVPVAR